MSQRMNRKKNVIDRLPVNIQQTILVTGNVIQRLLEKKLEEDGEPEEEVEHDADADA